MTYSMLLNIPNPRNSAFPIHYVSIFIYITSQLKPLPIYINIPQYYLSNSEMLLQ